MPVSDIPDIGLGTYENTDHDRCAWSVKTAINVGYRHVDTAQIYDNETAVGEGIAESDVDRDDLFVATKIDSRNLGYDEVLEHTEACMDRLDVDVVDLLYVHWPIRTYDPEATLAAFDHLYENGTIRHIGLSNFTPPLLEEALDVLESPLYAHQVECHPLLQQDELRGYAREEGHYLVAYSPVMKGRVTEVPELVDIAERHDATPGQVSLAWLLSKENVVVIPKASSEDHIRENLAALDLTLDDTDVELIDSIEREERLVDFDLAPWNT